MKILSFILIAGFVAWGLIVGGPVCRAGSDLFLKSSQVFEQHHQIFIILSVDQGEIFTPTFLRTLRDVTSDVFYLPGVDRTRVVSLTRVDTSFRDVIEDGFEGGPIIPEDFAYEKEGYEQIKRNFLKSPYVGLLASEDLKSALIIVPYFKNVSGQFLTKQIKDLLTQIQGLKYSLVGEDIFWDEFKKELGRSLVALVLTLGLAVIVSVGLKRFSGISTLLQARVSVKFSSGLQTVLLLALLVVSLVLAAKLFVGTPGSGVAVFRPDSRFQLQSQQAIRHFGFTLNSMLILAETRRGCTDLETVHALDDFHWYLTSFPGIQSIKSLPNTVKKLNCFFHENNLKWYSTPWEKRTLLASLAWIDPRTGLLDESGLILPFNVYFKNHNPDVLANVYEGIQNYKLKHDLFTLKIIGGNAGREAFLNQMLLILAKIVFFVVIGFVLLALSFSVPSSRVGPLFLRWCTIFLITLAWIALTNKGLNLNTLAGLLVGGSISLVLLIKHDQSKIIQGEPGIISLLLIAIVMSAGLCSQFSLLFDLSLISEVMLGFVYLLGLQFFNSRIDLEDPVVKP